MLCSGEKERVGRGAAADGHGVTEDADRSEFARRVRFLLDWFRTVRTDMNVQWTDSSDSDTRIRPGDAKAQPSRRKVSAREKQAASGWRGSPSGG